MSIKVKHNVKNDIWYIKYHGKSLDYNQVNKLVLNSPVVTKIVLPRRVSVLEPGCFISNKYLEEIDLNNVKSINNNSFSYCEKLKNVTFSNKLNSLGEGAFRYSGLESIRIPSKVSKIPSQCFNECVNLKDVIIDDGVVSIDHDAFDGCKNLENVKLPDTLVYIGQHAFDRCDSLKNMSLPKNVEIIDDAAFRNCSSLKKINMPKRLTRIGISSFNRCTSLEEVNFSDNLNYIGNSAFYGCSSLKKLDIPDSVEYIESFPFAECSSLKSVKLPKNLDNIPSGCFYKCNNLENVILPPKIEKIGYDAFSHCTSLKEIDLPESVKTIDVHAFYDCKSLKTIKVPITIEKVDHGAWSAPNSFIVSDIIIKDKNKEIMLEGACLVPASNCFNCLCFRDLYDNKLKFCYKGEYHEMSLDFSKVANKNNQINDLDSTHYVKLCLWMDKKKFIPHYTVIENMPIEDIDLFYKNDNCKKWAEILRHTPIQSNINKATLFKLCYALGVFQESGSKRDEAVEYIKEYILNRFSEDVIHARFDGLDLNNRFDPMWAEFFMKYYKDNTNFMMLDGVDLLVASYNNFSKVREAYPNKVVNTNTNNDRLSVKDVINTVVSVKYNNVKEENSNLALSAGMYGYSQGQFEKLQKWFDTGKKIKKEDIKLFISKDSVENDKITYNLLEKDNPLGAVLGNITNCCQVIGGAGESCVEYGMTQPNSKFMTFNLNKQIVGQSWVWYDEKTGVVCLDNIEVPTKYFDKINHNKEMQKEFVECLNRMANNFVSEMTNHGLKVTNVTIGEGFNDIKNILNNNFVKQEKVLKLSDYEGYSDATNVQFVIKTNKFY